jgi:hypothetical protein
MLSRRRLTPRRATTDLTMTDAAAGVSSHFGGKHFEAVLRRVEVT